MRIIFWEGCSRRFLWNISSCVTALSTEIITQDNWYGILCTHCEAAPTQHGFLVWKKTPCTMHWSDSEEFVCQVWTCHSVCQTFCSQGVGGVCLSACWDTHPPGQVPPGRYFPLGRYTPLAGTLPLVRYTPWAGTPPPMITAADGTHPTGMLSCWYNAFQTYCKS